MSNAQSYIIQCVDLTKSFDRAKKSEFRVLDKISLAVPSGSIVSILGASGCGKTTLLKLLAGLEYEDSGSVVSQIQRPGQKVGFMQQGERLLPWRTILDNVSLGLELVGASRKQALRTAEEKLKLVDLFEFRSAFPADISGGMTQRVLLARTLAQEPLLLLLDEPLGQLDIVGRRDLASIIRDYVRSSGAAVVLVTHSVEEAIFIADYVCTLSRRPAQIVERFCLNGGTEWAQAIRLTREECFDPIRSSLLSALALKGGE